MRSWIVASCLLFGIACKNDPKVQPSGNLAQDKLPVPVQELFNKLDKYPDSIRLRMQLVDALDSLGAYRLALGQMDSLIRNDSLNYGFWYRKAMLQENSRDTNGALRSYWYAIRIYPSPDAILAAANLLAEKKDSTALLLCQQVADLKMGREYTAHCHFITGIYLARTGNQAKAIMAFDNCIRNDLNYMEAYMEKGFLYFDAQKINEALEVFRTVTTIKNTYADGYYWMAKCEEKLKRPAEAIDNYKKSLVLDPKLTEASDALKRLGAS